MATNFNSFQEQLDLYLAGGTGQGFQGYAGTQGAQGFQGMQGRQGNAGIQGLQGDVGIQGVQGLLGLQGVQGVTGIIGTQGVQGHQGFQGALGIQGLQGVQGRQGVQGVPNAEFVITTAYQALGSSIKSVNLNHLTGWTTTAVGLTSQTAIFVPVYLQTAQSITGVMYEQDTAGVFTASNYNGFGLYSISAGTLSLVASTPTDGNLFKNADDTFVKKAFASPYSASAGVYYIATLYSSSTQTTQPAISGQTANFNIARADFSNSYVLCGTLGGQTALPATQLASGLTIGVSSVWVNLY